MKLRMGWFLLFLVCSGAYITYAAPQQIPVTVWKLTIVTLGGLVGYWLDRHLFPYARPHTFLQEPVFHRHAFCMAMLRRAIIVGASIIAFALAV